MPLDSEIPGSPREWLALAKADLALARAPLPEGALYESLCFHAQQAAEKAVKAVYRARKLGFAYIHDIGRLLAGLEREGVHVPEDVRESAVLTQFAWGVRYPGRTEPVGQDEYRRAVELAEVALSWAEGIIARETS